ncbi:MAG: Uma2 family endonuclease [Myxacorys chilensis ATA2-1-KO14]|jgi:Uma2 family endonuclease|nr:Uma2 family endonuclease [Myxacorys chilensis ATA2-1-KO14]
MVTLHLRQIELLPGQRVVLSDVNWQDFEAIADELGEHRNTRLAYSKGMLEIVAPLPEHEVSKEIIGDLVKILLEELDIDRECFGSTTFKRQDMEYGIEPDNCFYIRQPELMRGKSRVDLAVDPPPDLAIEIDVTSKTQLEAYQALGVSELWRYDNGKLRIDVLQNGRYIQSQLSPTFPTLPVSDAIPRFVRQSKLEGQSAALKAFRKWVKEQIQKNEP